MTLIKLKQNFHALIDSVENKELLDQFYRALSYSSQRKEGELFHSLTREEKDTLISAYDESKNKKNLSSHAKVMRKYSYWTTK